MRSHRKLALPEPNVRRWTVYGKAAVVQAIRSGALTAQQAAERYQLSAEELRAWERAFDKHGLYGLRATQISRQRKITHRP